MGLVKRTNLKLSSLAISNLKRQATNDKRARTELFFTEKSLERANGPHLTAAL